MEDKDFLDESIKPIQCSALRKGGYMLMQKKHPCKVIDITTSKPGKHGSAKAHIVGHDIFTGRRHEEIVTTRDRVLVPEVIKNELEISFLSQKNFKLFNEDMTVRNDLNWTEACSTPLKDIEGWLAEAEADLSGKISVSAVVVSSLGNAVVKEVKIKRD